MWAAEHPLGELLPGVTLRELAVRKAGSLTVALYWHPEANVLAEAVTDYGLNRALVFLVPNDSGLDALAHPFPYAAREGLFINE